MIAETTDLPTKFARIAVTDDQSAISCPDLPRANYSVLTRGYGLVVKLCGARHGLKHDDTKARADHHIAIEQSMRAPALDISRALILKAPRCADDQAARVDDLVEHDDAAALHRGAAAIRLR